MIKTKIMDGTGTGAQASVTPDNELLVSPSPNPPLVPQKIQIFNRYLTDDGLPDDKLAGGNKDLGKDGSTTPITYFIRADEDKDIYVTHLNVLMGYGASSYLWPFADAGVALTNGVLINYIDSSGVEVEIGNPINNSGFLRLGALQSGSIPFAWELRHLGSTNDYGYSITIPLADIVKPYGIQLSRGTKQQLCIVIRDDCTDADTFNCKAYGFERFE